MKNFALIGAGGFVTPRHLKAIHATGNRLIAAVDPCDSVGILDKYFPETQFFTRLSVLTVFLRSKEKNQNLIGFIISVSVHPIISMMLM